jgi:uncharacterized protein
MIPQRNLSLLANRLAGEGGRRLPEAVLERDYCLAWLLVGLSRSPLRERLAFKGGTAIKRCHFGDYRFSEDLDFTLIERLPFETIRAELEPVFEEVRRASGVVVRCAREDLQSHANSHTFYLAYEGPLAARSTNEVKVDITIRERLVLPLAERAIIRGYAEYEDLPEGAVVRTYSLDEIAVEKIVALGDRARNEPRDLYDIWYLTKRGPCRCRRPDGGGRGQARVPRPRARHARGGVPQEGAASQEALERAACLSDGAASRIRRRVPRRAAQSPPGWATELTTRATRRVRS